MEKFVTVQLGESLKIKTGEAVYHHSGLLKIWLRKHRESVEMVTLVDGKHKAKQPPKDAVWKKWMVFEESITVGFTPYVPDLPVQLAFPEPLIVPEGKNVSFYYWMAAWVNVKLSGDKQSTLSLGAFPTQPLSHTWTGNFFEGELVYEDFPDIHFEPKIHPDKNIFICPVEVKNKGNESLVISKLLMRLNNLSIYTDGEDYWLNKIGFDFGKYSELLDVRIFSALPKDLGKFSLVQKPIDPDRKSTLLRTFAPIRMKNTLILPSK